MDLDLDVDLSLFPTTDQHHTHPIPTTQISLDPSSSHRDTSHPHTPHRRSNTSRSSDANTPSELSIPFGHAVGGSLREWRT
jgi:hypothetical protein